MKISKIDVTLIDHMGSDLSVVNAARVSFNKESQWFADEMGSMEGILKKADANLIHYLARNKHFSPFNHAFLTFRVKAPIFVARQLVKHKFMPWNEVSRRYVDDEPEYYIPNKLRKPAENVKQGSSDDPVSDHYVDQLTIFTAYADKSYKFLLDSGVCPEQARMVLPLNTMTEWIWSGTLGAFADMLKLRLDPHTQQESREVAELIHEQIQPRFPVSIAALLENK